MLDFFDLKKHKKKIRPNPHQTFKPYKKFNTVTFPLVQSPERGRAGRMNSQKEPALRSLQEGTRHQQVKTRIQVSGHYHFPIVCMRVRHKRWLVQCPHQVKVFLLHL